MGLIEFDIQYL